MGNDGGSIPKRNELVKEKQKEVRPDQNALTIAIWFFCALSKRPLQEPVVSCALGKLYNKDAIIEYLLNNSAYGDGDTICSHINSLKDVVTLKLTTNLIYKENPNSHSDQGMTSKFVCPITMKEMNGKLKFVYLNTCGCTFSEQGLKEVPSDTCIQCGKPFNEKNVVVINPNPVEQEKLRIALVEKKSKSKKEKRKQKTEQEKAVTVVEPSSSSISSSSSSSSDKQQQQQQQQQQPQPQPQENKRKRDNENSNNVLAESSSSSSSSPSKRIAIIQPQIGDGGIASSVTAAVNLKVQEHLVVANTKAKKSKAIQSIYAKKNDDENKVSESYLVRGTFNRYA